MIIGDPVEHSLSPQMHNAGYQALGIDAEFVFVASHVTPENLEQAILGAKALGVHGITVTVPHKTAVIQYLDDLDETAQSVGAVNTIINKNGKLTGYNTDWVGVINPVLPVMKLNKAKVAVLGAGGAARAAVYGFTQQGADVTIFNRTLIKAQALADAFGCKAASLDELEMIKDMELIFNATSIGLGETKDQTPLPKAHFRAHHIVFDAIYKPRMTRFLTEAQERGAKTIQGLEMLLHQGLEQFKLYTGKQAPELVMRKVLESEE